MLVECANCKKLFDKTEAVGIVCDENEDTIEYLCSKKCIKEYPDILPKIRYIKFEK